MTDHHQTDPHFSKIERVVHQLDDELQRLNRKGKELTPMMYPTQYHGPMLAQPEKDQRHGQKSAPSTAFENFLRRGGNTNHHLDTLPSLFLEKKSLIASDTSGRFLVPNNVDFRFHHHIKDQSSIRSFASQTSIETDEMELVLDEGESTVGWVGEIQDRHETDTPKFIKKTIPIHEMYAKPRVSQRLLDDSSIDIEQWIVAHISKQMSMIENHSFLHGDGKDKPTGILHYALGDVTNGQKPAKGTLPTLFTNQEKGWITSDILIDATTTLPSIYGAQAMWLVSRSALAQLRLLKDPHTGRYLWQPSLTEGAPSTLLGFRVIVNDAMDPFDPKRSTTPILFGNFESGYQIVDRQGVHVLRDPYCAKPYVEFYTTKRVGGDVIHLEAFVAISCVSSS